MSYEWLKLKNPPSGKTGKDLATFMKKTHVIDRKTQKKRNLKIIDITQATGVSPSYIRAIVDYDKEIKKNLYDRLKDGFPKF